MRGETPLRVVITGGTSGIGRAVAVELGRRGAKVAVTGRRQDKLDETARLVREAGGQCLPLMGSVSAPEDVRRHYREIKKAWGGLDWAILNAGVGDRNDAKEFKAETVRWTFETNILGLAQWLEAVIPDMVAAGRGTIAGVASIAGYRGLPRSGAYSASKAAMVTLLESTRVDLRPAGVKVVTVCPGYVKSELTDRNDPSDMWFVLEADDAARRIIRGVEEGRRLVHFPWQLSIPVIYLLHWLPDFLYDAWIARIAPRRKKPYLDESKKT